MIPQSPSKKFLTSLASQLNVKYSSLLDLASMRLKMELPAKQRTDTDQFRISLERQAEIYQAILDNSHPAPGQNSCVMYSTKKVRNLGMKMFLRYDF